MPRAENEVIDAVLDEARAKLVAAETELSEAEAGLTAAADRATSLQGSVAATLEPLRSSARGAPDQAEVVLGMYPAAEQSIVEQLRSSARLAADSTSAELFTFDNDHTPTPVVGGGVRRPGMFCCH